MTLLRSVPVALATVLLASGCPPVVPDVGFVGGCYSDAEERPQNDENPWGNTGQLARNDHDPTPLDGALFR